MNGPEYSYQEIPSAHEDVKLHEDGIAKQEAYGTLDKEIANDLATLQLDLEQPSNYFDDPDGTFEMKWLPEDEHPPVRVA